ncbi:MAG: LCP family protein [Anaerolineales bacterium]|nr:LCP family protein [Anaerolineales bacterium]MCX7607942.1 LCP family protein [Anaerolineales bacterium]MDW8227084.1 LCP family protein [Anaerolineales bacterium]
MKNLATRLDFFTSLRLRRPTGMQGVLLVLALAIALGLFVFVRSFVACWQMTALPGVPVPACFPSHAQEDIVVQVNEQGTPVLATRTSTPSVPEVALPPPWDGASRVTVLLIGLDYRDWEAGVGAPRSDTMILMTLDPKTMTAGVLSIPRDLWVNIPGFGYNRINNAYSYGEGSKLPGGGPGLAMKTVERFLGVEIDYYAQVDFLTFERMIDIIGGVCLEVPEKITVGRTYASQVTLEPGYQCLDGKTTLGYARTRYTEGGDIDRAKRQQQVMRAIMDKVFDPARFPDLIRSAPELYNELSSGIRTNMSLNDALRLAVLVRELKRENIVWGTIDYTMADLGVVEINGNQADILRPFPDAIRNLVDKVFGLQDVRPLAEGDLTQKMQAEAARVAVVNGAGVEGLAARASEYLKGQGMHVVAFGNPGDYPVSYRAPFPKRTVIIVRNGGLYAMEYLRAVMAFDSPAQIIFDYDPESPVDLILALGSDYERLLP